MHYEDTTMSSLPIEPSEPERPILPQERWRLIDGWLVKQYHFRKPEDKARLVNTLLKYEEKVGHQATLIITPDSLTVKVQTANIESITNLDKEYASFCDVSYKDISLT